MADNQPKIDQLETRISELVRTQIDFQKEISAIRKELASLRGPIVESEISMPAPAQYVPPVESLKSDERSVPPDQSEPTVHRVETPNFGYSYEQTGHTYERKPESEFERQFSAYVENARSDFEKFIGENLISKIGIIVLIIGVGIGVKYSIDNELISPLTRIIIGYIFGFGLVGLAIKLKPKYHNFSAALISGGMAIMYFVTYFAYSSYSLITQSSAFALMVMFTAFTVASAGVYNRQIIAHIGLVGAYGVPFLLSSDSGNYIVLFSYMTIVNLGILAVSLKRRWEPIFFTASGFTWLIFLGWFSARYEAGNDLFPTLIFLGVFFAIFFAVAIIQHETNENRESYRDLGSALATTFVFYCFCWAIADTSFPGGRVWAFFGYLTAAAVAICLVSFRYLGRFPVYFAFTFSWLIYGVWFVDRYVDEEHRVVAPVFAAVFFAVFYAAVLGHRLITRELTFIENTGLILSNAFLFFGFGYAIMVRNGFDEYLGLFTVANGALHLGVASLVAKLRDDAVDVIQVLTILVLTFGSIAIPIQFDGNVVTMIWAAEAAILFWYGRTKAVPLFEYFSFPVMALATASMLLDWGIAFSERTLEVSELNRQPLANSELVTAIVFVTAFAFIFITNRDDRFRPPFPRELATGFGVLVASVGLFVLYNAFRIEISNYFHLRIVEMFAGDAAVGYRDQTDNSYLKFAWQLNYTFAFLTALIAVNLRKTRSQLAAAVGSGLTCAALFAFTTIGMFAFSALMGSYLAAETNAGQMNVLIRYISYLFAAAAIAALYFSSRDELLTVLVPGKILVYIFEGIVISVTFITASCELVNLMAQWKVPDSSKLGLSILWGIYALALIVLGIAWKKKHLRIIAIVILAITLIKLFLYDIADLDTIPKTILFVTLGITLLVISFLYNKYKVVMFGVDGADDSRDGVDAADA